MAARPESLPGLSVEYRSGGDAPLGPDVLGALAYGPAAVGDDPRWLRVGLGSADRRGLLEVWRGKGTVERGVAGPIRYACDDALLFGILEVAESEHGGLRGAARFAYDWIAVQSDNSVIT